jgi:uncharacterized PurR-regulated membrane protein YhhQ (DUF165 family)
MAKRGLTSLEPNGSTSGSAGAEIAEVQGVNKTRLAMVIGVTIILSILAIGIVVAVARDPKQERDYAAVLLPVVASAISGFVGYLAGQKARKE